jgi:hypothetical protein
MFAVFNMETGDFCSESPVLTAEAKRNGQRATGNAGTIPAFFPFLHAGMHDLKSLASFAKAL